LIQERNQSQSATVFRKCQSQILSHSLFLLSRPSLHQQLRTDEELPNQLKNEQNFINPKDQTPRKQKGQKQNTPKRKTQIRSECTYLSFEDMVASQVQLKAVVTADNNKFEETKPQFYFILF